VNNEQGKACMPGGQFGICHKWFGRCHTVNSNVPVNFAVFNDGYASQTQVSDAVYIPKDGNQACIPIKPPPAKNLPPMVRQRRRQRRTQGILHRL